MEKLRASVEQILTAAADEIFGVFKRSIAEIEEKLSDSLKDNKRNQGLPEAVHQTDIPEQQGRSPHMDQEDPQPPHNKEAQGEEWISQEGEQTMKLMLLSECPTLIQKLWMVKEELPPEQQERSPSLDQVDPEPSHTKEEGNLLTNQEGEQLQGLEEADITKFPSIPPCVKNEYDEDKAHSSQLHQSQTEENTEESDRIQNKDFPISDVACNTTHQRTEDEKPCKVLSVSDTQTTVHTAKMPLSCSVCNRGFRHQSRLKTHMSVHTGEKPFSCPVCNRGFALKSNVKAHMLVHTGEKPFSCSICKRSFALKGHIKAHMLVHTKERPFSCSVCNKVFARKCEVKQHMPIHTSERPFSCSVCKKGFAQKSKLNEHMLSHAEEKPFNCSVCNKGFGYKQNLKKHMLTHTGKKASLH